MEYKVLSEKKNEMEFELRGEDHSFGNLLLSKLLENEDVEVATYAVKHPQVGSPYFFVKTRKGEPKKAVKEALESLKKDIKALGR